MKKKEFRHYEFLSGSGSIPSSSLFLIYGENEYFKEKVLKTILHKFKKETKDDLDFVTFFGEETKISEVMEQLEMLPFFAKKRVIVLKNFDAVKDSDKKKIADYSEDPVESTILIITNQKPDKRKTVFKKLLQNSVSIECRKPYNADGLKKFLRAEAAGRSTMIETPALNLFAENIELDYLIASNELEKLILFTKNAPKITLEDVQKCIKRSKMQVIFELQNALGMRDKKRSFDILHNMLDNFESGIFIIVMLTRFFLILLKISALRRKNIADSEIINRHLNEIFRTYRREHLDFTDKFQPEELLNIFSYLMEADHLLKSSGTEMERIVLERLVFKICAVSPAENMF